MILRVLILSLFITLSIESYSQVGINTYTPDSSAALDIVSNNKGILIPRVTKKERDAIISPANGLIVYDTESKCISQNAGSANTPFWVCLSDKDKQSESFYMPSISIDASTVVTNQTIDLYSEYKKQFDTPPIVSTGAPTSIPYFQLPTDLYYYITLYDDTVLKINSLNESGVLNYDILKEADYATFMNVVFVIK